MNTITITFSDGTTATWLNVSEASINLIGDLIYAECLTPDRIEKA